MISLKKIPLLVAGVRKIVQLPPLHLVKATQRTTFLTKAKTVAESCTQSASCKDPSNPNPKATQAHDVSHLQSPNPAPIDTSDDGPAFPGWRMSRRQYHEYIANMRWTSNPCGVKADIFTPADWRWIRGESDVNTLEGMAWVNRGNNEKGPPRWWWRCDEWLSWVALLPFLWWDDPSAG